MSKEEKIPPVFIAVKALDESIKENHSKEVVNDHEICYGTSAPLCGKELGNKGITETEDYITCPKCKTILGGGL